MSKELWILGESRVQTEIVKGNLKKNNRYMAHENKDCRRNYGYRTEYERDEDCRRETRIRRTNMINETEL